MDKFIMGVAKNVVVSLIVGTIWNAFWAAKENVDAGLDIFGNPIPAPKETTVDGKRNVILGTADYSVA